MNNKPFYKLTILVVFFKLRKTSVEKRKVLKAFLVWKNYISQNVNITKGDNTIHVALVCLCGIPKFVEPFCGGKQRYDANLRLYTK